MKNVSIALLIGSFLLFSAFKMHTSMSWKTAENYSVTFTTDKFEGMFRGLKSEILFDENNLAASRMSATIETATINTGNGMRNKHAMQGLEADKYPHVKFESSSISKAAAGYEASGKLTIKDVTKTIKLPFTFAKTAAGGVFTGGFTVVPADYNVKKAGTPSLFQIKLNVPVTK